MITPYRKRMYSSPASFIVSVSSIVATRIITSIVKIIGDVVLAAPYQFDANRTYLVLSNHQSRLDPFILYGSLGLQQNIACAPTKFLTAKSIYYGPLYLWLVSMGCYPTKNRRITVPETVDHLSRGYSVCLFPEGRRTLRSESNPKDGTRLILDEIKRKNLDITIVLVHIEWERPYRLFRKATVRMQEAHPAIYTQDMPDIMRMIYEIL